MHAGEQRGSGNSQALQRVASGACQEKELGLPFWKGKCEARASEMLLEGERQPGLG